MQLIKNLAMRLISQSSPELYSYLGVRAIDTIWEILVNNSYPLIYKKLILSPVVELSKRLKVMQLHVDI